MTVTIERARLDYVTPAKAPLLEVEDLSTTFGRGERAVNAVRGVNFTIESGSTLVLLGESGSGKSVTARSILQLYGTAATHGGSVRFDGTEIVGLNEAGVREIRGARIALISQDPGAALDPMRRVGRQIDEVLHVHRRSLDKTARRHRVLELLSTVGLPDARRAARSYAHELSGGMRQRVAIALAISCEPELLIADEPTTALDVTVQAQILGELESLKARFGMAILLVTHDVGVAKQMADEIAVMYAGRIVEIGPTDAVLNNPRHPYTAALLSCIPTPDMQRGDLHPLPGRPPLAGEDVVGCPFAPRCMHASDICRKQEPALRNISPQHASACVLVDEREERAG